MTKNMTQETQSTDPKAQDAGADATYKRSAVTLKDVARRANVSPTTASLFFNGREDVCAKSTAVRLRQAAAELHYSTNRGRPRSAGNRNAADPDLNRGGYSVSGRALSTDLPDFSAGSRTPTRSVSGAWVLGVSIPVTAIPYSSSNTDATSDYTNASLEAIWRGITRVADIENCQILQYPRRTREGITIAPFLDDSRVDGIVMAASLSDSRPALLAEAGLPVVLLGRPNDIPDGCGAVFTLESDTVDLAMSHLWQLGHRRIAYISSSATSVAGVEDGIAKRRLERFLAWTQIRDVYSPELVAPGIDLQTEGNDASATVARMMRLAEPPTAIFCENDTIAVNVCRAALAAGLEVPGQLSIVGVGNSAQAGANRPAISSVEVPFEEIGIQAVVQLTRLLEGANPAACRTAIAVTNLVTRASTGPAPVGR